MNSPFTKLQPQLERSLWGRLWAWRAPLVFGVCVLLGLGLVWWRAQLRVDEAYAAAREQARACAAALELQLNQSCAAAEVLGMMARHARPGLTNSFQRLGQEVFAAHSSLASVELQPGGVVGDIVPRQGNERAIGLNVLKDPGQRAGAIEAIARRALTATIPVTLYRGEQGIVARVPLFQRGPDGKEFFWGFVAASMRLQDALTRAQLPQLSHQGYDFALSVTASPKPKVIAAQGLSSSQEGVQQQIHALNVELRLGLKPRGGWINKSKLALDAIAVCLISAIVSLLVIVLESRRAMDGDLSEATQQLARAQADRKQALADFTGLREKLAATQAELKQAELSGLHAKSRADQIQVQLEAALRQSDEAARAQEAERTKTQAELKGAQETIVQLQARVNAASEAEAHTGAAAKEQAQQHQAAMLELRKQLDAATRSARKSAETGAASLAELEQSNRELRGRLEMLEGAEARVLELEGLLREAQDELAQAHAGAAPEVNASPAAAPEDPSIGDVEALKPASASEELAEPGAVSEPAQQPAVVAETKTVEQSVPVSTAAPEPEPEPPSAEALPASESPAPNPASKKRERRPKRPDNQMDLFGKGDAKAPLAAEPVAKAEVKTPAPQAREEAAVPARRLAAAPPVDVALLRTATNQIVPLLTDADPGARDCLRDNRTAFRSAFTPEGYLDFEQLVKKGEFASALEQLKKAVRKHGI